MRTTYRTASLGAAPRNGTASRRSGARTASPCCEEDWSASSARPTRSTTAATTKSCWDGCSRSTGTKPLRCFSSAAATNVFIHPSRSRRLPIPITSCTAGEGRIPRSEHIPGRCRLQIVPAHLGERALRVDDELSRHAISDRERRCIDVAKQHVVDAPDERGDAGDLLLALSGE